MAAPLSLEEQLRGIPEEKLNRVCEREHFLALSASITEWQWISPFLGLEESEEEDIVEKYQPKRRRLELLTTWKRKLGQAATYRKLVEAFERAKRRDLVDELCSLLRRDEESESATATAAMEPTTLSSNTSTTSAATTTTTTDATTSATLQSYKAYLKGRYKAEALTPPFAAQWPPPPTCTIINLAMISKERVGRGAVFDSEFVRLTLHGNVDDILEMKTPVKLEEILSIDKAERKVILIEGAPGSGKTTLAWLIVQKWKAGELFQEFELVVLVQLRDPAIQLAKSISDLLPCSSESQLHSVVSEIEACCGNKTLWILDGWDELPPLLQTSSFFQQLIKPPRVSPLTESAVIVTSRPVSSANLHPLASSRVEVIGFTEAQLQEYFQESLEHDAKKKRKLQDCLSRNPRVESSCYLPLNAAIIVHLFLALGCSLPSILHRVFCLVVACIVFRYMKDRANRASEVPPLTSLDGVADIRLCFPPDIREHFRRICQLALRGIWENRLTFSEYDLQQNRTQSSSEVCTLGLLQAVESLVCVNKTKTYHFLHLSVQELLAAFCISDMSPQEQVQMFQSRVGHPRFTAVLEFYAGLTKFSTPGFQNVIISIVQKRDKLLLVSLIRCLHEVQNPLLCRQVAAMLQWKLRLQLTTLTPNDCLSIGYFSACVCHTELLQQELLINLESCSLDDNCVKYLVRGLLSTSPTENTSNTPHPPPICKLYLWLPNNNIQSHGALSIARILRGCSLISKLVLNGNSTNRGIGEVGLCHITEGLMSNSSVVGLYLPNCSIQITGHSGPMVAQMLQRNTTLQVLNLAFNKQVSDSGALYIAEGLAQNTTLTELHLMNCGITAVGAKSLAKALSCNRTLKLLSISKNNLTDVGVFEIAESFKLNTSLKTLRLTKCNITYKGAESLAGALVVNKSLNMLLLNTNYITDRGAAVLADSLKVNQSLKHLEVADNRISDRGVEDLASMLEMNTSLEILTLTGNPIQGPGLQKLGSCLKKNRTLNGLSLVFPQDSNHPVLIACLKQLVTSLAENCSLQRIDVNPQHHSALTSELQQVNIMRTQRGYPTLTLKQDNPLLFEAQEYAWDLLAEL